MKTNIATVIAAVSLVGTVPSTAADDTAVVSVLQPNHDTQGCIFFRLSGVTNITPTSVGDWFAIPRSSPGAMEAFAVLLTSRSSASP